MKPYKIIKPKGNTRKPKVVGPLPVRRIPLYFIKNVHPFVYVEFTARSGHQQTSTDDLQDP